MKDAMAALRTLVLATPEVTDLVDDRVYVNKIPRAVIEAQDTFQPQKMIVLRQGGGSGKADLLPTDDILVTVLCYGETQLEADTVRRTAWERFVNLSRERHAEVLIHHINPAGGPIPLVDPDIVWPAVSQGFTLKANVMEEVA